MDGSNQFYQHLSPEHTRGPLSDQVCTANLKPLNNDNLPQTGQIYDSILIINCLLLRNGLHHEQNTLLLKEVLLFSSLSWAIVTGETSGCILDMTTQQPL